MFFPVVVEVVGKLKLLLEAQPVYIQCTSDSGELVLKDEFSDKTAGRIHFPVRILLCVWRSGSSVRTWGSPCVELNSNMVQNSKPPLNY